ncbi:MAG TPA: ATP-binding protein [Candidatus Udaeobacter sp.]|nr:ATP-binding protein [Candidatus Udaeobacter sp.]
MNTSAAIDEEAPSRPLWWAYMLAVISTVATIILLLGLDSWAPNRPPLILFVIPIILSAYVGGAAPGLLSTFLVAVSTYFLSRPGDVLAYLISFDFVQWVTLIIAGVLISLLNEALHRSRLRAELSERLRLAENTARLADTERHLTVALDDVTKRSRHLAVLNTIGAAVSQSLDLSVIVKQAVDKIAETLTFDAVWIYELEPRGKMLRMIAYQGLSDEMAKGMAERSIDRGISAPVLKTGTRLVFEDLQNDERYRELTRAGTVASLGFKAGAAFPIRTKDKIIGTLHVTNLTRRHFASEELQLLESIAQQVGVASENAKLFAELREAKERAELSDRAKSDFLANMSHELRTPLNAIIGFSEMLVDEKAGPLNANQKDFLNDILKSGRHLLEVINDVLDLARVATGKLELNAQSFSLREAIAETCGIVKPMADAKNVAINVDAPVDNDIVTLDPLRFKQVLYNLLSNAIKYNYDNGDVKVAVSVNEQKQIRLQVKDTGIGIKEEDLPRIFDDFIQLNIGTTKVQQGTGLGLALTKKIVEEQKGSITAESEVGQGSRFTVVLPIASEIQATNP